MSKKSKIVVNHKNRKQRFLFKDEKNKNQTVSMVKRYLQITTEYSIPFPTFFRKWQEGSFSALGPVESVL